MSSVSAVREKLEEMILGWHFGRGYCSDCESYDHECGCSPTVTERRVKLYVSEALALLEGEPSELVQCAMCGGATYLVQYHKCVICETEFYEAGEMTAEDKRKALAILATDSESEEPGA